MAIFGMHGLQAAALYLAVSWGVYRQKDAGFKKGGEEEKNIVTILSRKNAPKASASDKKAALVQLRERRYQALIEAARARPGGDAKRYEDEAYKSGGAFQKAYVKLPYAR